MFLRPFTAIVQYLIKKLLELIIDQDTKLKENIPNWQNNLIKKVNPFLPALKGGTIQKFH